MASALRLALLLGALLGLVAGGGRRSLTPQEMDQLAFAQHPGARLDGGAILRDEDGSAVTVKEACSPVGRQSLVFDYLHCPNLCGLVLGDLADALTETPLVAGRDYRVLAVSIDPEETAADAAQGPGRLCRCAIPTKSPDGISSPATPRPCIGSPTSSGFLSAGTESIGQFAHPAGADAGGARAAPSSALLCWACRRHRSIYVSG